MKQLCTTKLLYLSLITLFSFTSCGDKEEVKPVDNPTSPPIENPSEPVEEPETPVVHKTPCRMIAISREDSPAGRKFEYNEKGLVSKVTYTLVSNTGSETTEILYHYNNKNQVIKMEYMQDGVIYKHYSLAYTDGLLSTNKVYEGAKLKYTENYTYDADKKLISISIGNRTLDYKYDSDGNVIEETDTNTNGIARKTTFENYDDKIEPYLSVTGYLPLYGGTIKQNYTKMTQTFFSNGEISSTYTDTYTYEYNEHNLPTKVYVSSSKSSATFVINFTYECD